VPPLMMILLYRSCRTREGFDMASAVAATYLAHVDVALVYRVVSFGAVKLKQKKSMHSEDETYTSSLTPCCSMPSSDG
jgi:hypothetical protein